MRQLLPGLVPDASVGDMYGDLLDRAAALPAGRPYMALNMVASVDGAIALNGRSGGLSSPADKEAFFYLRSLADVILVGASTARAEDYGPAKLPAHLVAARQARGQAPLPRIAVVTRSMELDWSARLFDSAATSPPTERPYVICPSSAPQDRQAAAARVAEVISSGETEVVLAAALNELAAAGARVVLCEGGPTLNGQLLSAGLADELCLTVSPVLVGGLGDRISGWRETHEPLSLTLLALADAAGVLMLRYQIVRA